MDSKNALSVFEGLKSNNFKIQKLVVFEGKNIRKTWFKEEWWFSVVDIIEVLTQTNRPRKYWSDLKTKLLEEGFQLSDFIGQLKVEPRNNKEGSQMVTKCNRLKLLAEDGKF